MDDNNNILDQIRAAKETFRWNNQLLSEDQLELAWLRMCATLPGVVGYTPEKPRISSWTGYSGSSQVTVRQTMPPARTLD